MPSSSRTFRVLLSSAFSGLAEERKILHGEVFPKLRDLCARHGWRFQAVELSPGMEPCGTAYICALGERYGKPPLPEVIPAPEFSKIEEGVPGSSAAFLREWYRQDVNSIPPVWVLQRPSGVFAQPETWERFVAAPLRGFLQGALRGLEWAPEARLKYETSQAEQEIEAALSGKEGAPVHVFCCSSGADASSEPDPDARARLDALRKRLRQRLAGNFCQYSPGSPGTIAAPATAALSRAIQAEVKRTQVPAPADRGAEIHRAFGRARAGAFTGRTSQVERIAQYLHGADPHPLVVTGPSGSGKSALLAHSLERYRALRRDATVLFRVVGATADSLDGCSLLADLCRQLGQAEPESARYADLVECFPGWFKASADRGPVAVVVDGIDLWPPLDQARDLDWLPVTVPAGARLIVSTSSSELLSGLKKKLPAGNIVELDPMGLEEAGRALDQWLRESGRSLTPAQRARVLVGFGLYPLPLYLRLAFEEARTWRSYEPVSATSPSPDVAGQFDAALEHLAARHGRTLVARCLAYLAAARHGLAEDELHDLLSRDGLVTPAAWPLLKQDLHPYLCERAAGTEGLLAFAHREFAEAAVQAFLQGDERSARHEALAVFFERSPYPARRFAELARQQALAGLWAPLEATLTSFEFAEAKAGAGLFGDLIEDHRVAEACWRAAKVGPPPWNDWSRFLVSERRMIEGQIGKCPQIVFQQAFNHSRGGRVSLAAQLLAKQGHDPKQSWFERVNRPELPPGRDCLLEIAGHVGPVTSLALAGDDALAVSGGVDGTIRISRLSTGSCLHVLRGHTSGVMAVLIAGPNRDRVVSASWDCTVRVWNLHTGQCLKVLAADTCPVVSLAAVGPDRVAAGAADGSLRLWEIETGQCLTTFRGHRGRINSILAIPGHRITSASDDGSVHIWREDGTRLGVLTGHGGPVLHLNWIAGTLSTSCWSGKIILWDLETGKARDILSGHTGGVAGTAPLDSARMVSWSYDNTLRFWSLVDGSQLLTLARHQGPVATVTVLKDGRLLSASCDSTLRLWDPRGDAVGTLAGHRSWVTALAAGAAGVVSASRDGTLRVWDLEAVGSALAGHPVETPAEIARAQDLAGVYVVDAAAAISITTDPESLQLWELAEGRCLQSALSASEAGRQLRERLGGHASGPGPSFCGAPLSQWGFAIRSAPKAPDQPSPGLVLIRQRQREDGSFDGDGAPLAFYPLACGMSSWAFECEYGIAFDAHTREPHIVKVHRKEVAAEEPAPAIPSGGLRSLMRRFLGRGENL